MFKKLLIIILLLPTILFSQSKIQVLDQNTREPIPFAKITFSSSDTKLADLDGFFSLSTPDALGFITIKAIGYFDSTFQSEDFQATLYLRPELQLVDEVRAVAGENPAHRVINQVIANRKKNNPTDQVSFQYDAYSKFVFTLDPEALQEIPVDTQDSNLISMRNFFSKQDLFIIENQSERKFIPPSRDKETIIAYKVSGFSDPSFSTFASEMQSFSFYENQFKVLGKSYINPIALGGTKRYLFVLEDTLIRNQDTVFTISFRPRKGTNFDGLKGQLFINTNGFAIEKVISEPANSDESIAIKIVQEYEFMYNERWFPSKLSSEVRFNGIQLDTTIKNSNIVGKGNTYLKNIQFNPELKKSEFSNITIETAENAGSLDETSWDTTRFYALSEKEKQTYLTIDSISKEYKFDKRFELLKVFSSGKIPIGKRFDLDAKRLISYNLYENYRFGTGIETADRWMKRFKVGGYFGWATGDKAWKYGGFSEVLLVKKREVRFRISYQDDLIERGGNAFRTPASGFSNQQFGQQLYVQNFEKQQLAEAILSGYPFHTFRFSLLGNYQRIRVTDGYAYQDLNLLVTENKPLDLSEIGVEISWQPREKVMILGGNRVSKGSKYPRFTAKISKGIPGVFDASLDYTRARVDVQQTIAIRAAGKLMWSIGFAETQGNVPLFLLHTAAQTGGNWRISIPNSFETVLPSTYFANRQAHLFTRFTFNAQKTKYKWTKPQLVLHHAIGYGTIRNRTNHIANFYTMDKGYFEGGVVIDKLFISGMSGIGIGVFMPYGAYAVPQLEKNVTVKLSVSVNL